MQLTVHLVLVVLQLQRSCFTLVRSSTSMPGVFKSQTFVEEDLAARNFFAQPMSDSYGYAKAFLSMIYAWNGFDQLNYMSIICLDFWSLAYRLRSSVKQVNRVRYFPWLRGWSVYRHHTLCLGWCFIYESSTLLYVVQNTERNKMVVPKLSNCWRFST